MDLHFKDLYTSFKNLMAENANLIDWFGDHIFECIWFVDIEEKAIWGNFNYVPDHKKTLDFEKLCKLNNENSGFLQVIEDFIKSEKSDEDSDFYNPEVDSNKWRFHFKKIYSDVFQKKEYVFILQQYIPYKEKYLSLYDENSYLKKLIEVYDKTNEVAQIGGWMIDLVNSNLFWTKVTRDIHEVDDDYVPDLTTGINFYVEGENRERITRLFTKAVEEGSSYMDDFEIITAKNNRKWVKVFGSAEREGGKVVRVYGAFQDITEQKLQDSELKLSQSRFQDIFDNSPLGIILSDPETDTVYHVNKSAMKIFGLENLPVEEVQRFSFKENVFEEDLAGFYEERKKLLEGQFDNYVIECRYYKNDGSIIWLQSFTSLLRAEDGTPRLMIAQVEDITLRKTLEAESFKNASQFKSSFDYSPNGMALVSLNGKWINVNRNLSKMIGYTKEELLKMSFMDVTYHEDLDKDLKLLSKLMAGEIDTYNMEKRYIHKKGHLLWGLLTVSLQKDEDGKPLYFISQINDITAAKEAQENINKSYRELQNMMDATTQVSIIESDLNGVIKKFNKGAENFFGYKAEEMIDKEKVFIFHDKAEIKKRELELSKKYGKEVIGFDVFTTGAKIKEYESLEWTYIRKNGERFPVQLVITAIKNSEGTITGYVGVATDITQLKSIQEALKQSEQRWQFALEGSGDGIWDWFIDSNTQFLSVRAREMLGFEESDDLTNVEEWDKRIHPRDQERSEKALRDYFTGKTPIYHVEKRIKCKNGQYKWILDRGKVTEWTEDKKPMRMIGTQSDITDRKIAERKIKENEARFRSLYQLSPIGIGLIDVETGTFIEANQSLIKSSGYTKEEFTGIYYQKITPEEFIPLVTDRFKKVVLNEKVEPFEKGFIKKDGTVFPALVNGAKIKDTNGRDVILATIQDITSRKEMENSLIEAKLKAEAASKSKSEFLANMSHEIRTPLNGVIGFTDLLMKTKLDASQQQYMQTVYNSANTLLDLINDILDFSKIEAGKLELNVEKVNIIELCGQTIDVVRQKAHEKGLEVLLNVSPNVDRFIYGDSVRIRQILTNLLGNAVKFTDKGEIELKVEAGEINKEYKREYKFVVRDTGIGIAPENLERIFKAFDQEDSSTTRKYGGTGLGLTISNKLLSIMDSKLELKSEPGVGSTFSFKVCFESEQGESFLNTNLQKINNVLVIDDNYNNQVILKEMLAIEDINCDAVSNAIEALSVLEKENKYQLAIVDYNMPYMTGVDFITHLRNELKINADQLPLILLHSSAEEEKMGKACKELDVQFSITKPIKIDQLFGMLNQIQAPLRDIKENTVDAIKEKTFEDNFRILIAEDNPVNKFLAKTILMKAVPKAQIFEVENGLDAVSFYKEHPLDIIFMDIQMPVMSGFEASEEIRKFETESHKGQHVPIIALTARTVKGEKGRCIDAGMDDYITKPVVFETIRAVIQEYLLDDEEEEGDVEDNDSLKHFDKQKLLEKFDHDQNAYDQLMQIVEQSLEEYPKQLRRRIEHRDLDGINKLGHKIKGSAQNCCFYKLEYLAARLEEFDLFKESILLDLEKKIEAEINLLKDSI
ncbi:PAS domain S-box protein [Zunongwangia pacifica]|uniref:histidine kinase n=1 Tax=Zunongwangia pacifica TaxID=2911062 RepID=A0A9X2CQ47_9FLAO|nr:PAS domain S-box protein [Zunongwangia pacifica]MCL6218852.1 PAS domain S-box protein [Zunongwangia pacifica]